MATISTATSLGELRRIDGVGSAQLFATQRAMRIWIDPDKMVGLNLTADDIIAAIRRRTRRSRPASIGAPPNPVTQRSAATVLVQGAADLAGGVRRHRAARQSRRLLRAAARRRAHRGGRRKLQLLHPPQRPAECRHRRPAVADRQCAGDIQRGQREDGGAVALLPGRLEYSVPYDTSPFVAVSIEKVVHTLLEAVALVFVVMFLFLQNFRYTIIPTLVVPVALLGTCAVMFATGFSINVLTMFAMVLAIGILVDDAIVVVENVERIMAEEGLVAEGGDHEGDEADHRRHHRHHAGADGGLRSHGVFPRRGRHHLPAVQPDHGRLDPVLGFPGACR